MKKRVIKVEFSTLPTGNDRPTSFSINGKSCLSHIDDTTLMIGPDLFLFNLLNILPSPNYTVIYTTTPLSSEKQHPVSEPSTYQMDNTMSPLLHIDLKRDLAVHERAASAIVTSLPLFEKYQYFTPGKHCELAYKVPKCTKPFRHFHGGFSCIYTLDDLLRCHFRRFESSSIICCI